MILESRLFRHSALLGLPVVPPVDNIWPENSRISGMASVNELERERASWMLGSEDRSNGQCELSDH